MTPDSDSRQERLEKHMDRIVSKLLRVPESRKMEVFKAEIAQIPSDIRRPVETAVLQAEEILTGKGAATWEKILFAACLLLAFAVFTMIWYSENVTPGKLQAGRTVMALAAAGVGWVTPGFISIEIPFRDGYIRAGGAAACFALVYGFDPTSMVV